MSRSTLRIGRLRDFAEQGMTQRAAAAILGIDPSLVCRTARAHNIAFKGRGKVYRTYKRASPTVDTLFRQGLDTLEISERIGISEARVLRRVSVMRSRRLDKPSPYQSKE